MPPFSTMHESAKRFKHGSIYVFGVPHIDTLISQQIPVTLLIRFLDQFRHFLREGKYVLLFYGKGLLSGLEIETVNNDDEAASPISVSAAAVEATPWSMKKKK